MLHIRTEDHAGIGVETKLSAQVDCGGRRQIRAGISLK
jgi:hypothetical protein